jgi:hypothetical protein
MDGSIRELLDPRVLAQAYEQTSVSDATPFADAFWAGQIDVCPDDTYTSLYRSADVKPMAMNAPGSEARTVVLGATKPQVFSAFYSFNRTMQRGAIYDALREPDSYSLQDKGRNELTRLLRLQRSRQRKLKNLVIAKALTAGTIYVNAAGEVLENSTGAVQSIDLQVPSGNKTNIGGVISALWSAAGTDVFTQMDQIRDVASSNTVPVPTDVWLNKVNFYALRNNTGSGLQTYFSRNPDLNDTMVRKNDGGNIVEYVIPDLNGFTWHFVDGYYEAADGTKKPMIPKTGAGSMVMTPPPNGDWVAKANGRELIPNSIDVNATMEASLANANYVDGEFFYAKLEHNPMRLDLFTGDKFFFGFNEPNAVFIGTAF